MIFKTREENLMNEESLKEFGPLRLLIGVWEGEKGEDIAPADDRGTEKNKYRERMVIEPVKSPIANHEQKLYGLRYSTRTFRLDETEPFHDEVGYWLWDPKDKQVFKCVSVPRGMVALAGGPAEADAKSFKLKAELGSPTFGICSNPFLDVEFQTVRYELEIKINGDGSFSYDQNAFIKIKGQQKLFEHRDINTLRRVEEA
jgi:hypothetical protein